MKQVLLINTPIFSKNRDPDAGNNTPPMGLGYIYTQLTQSGYECQFRDAVIDSLMPDEILKIIDGSSADYIGLNTFSSNLGIVRYIVENVDSSKKLILGGPATYALIPEIIKWNPKGIITVITGEAELIIPEFIKNPTIAEKISSKLHIVNVTPGSIFYPSLIDLPLDRSIFKNDPIRRTDLGVIESHIITSRGCCYNCAFCSAARSINKQSEPRFRTYESLASEIDAVIRLHPEINSIRVLDDLFLRDSRSIDIGIKLFSESNVVWRSMAHINTFRDLSPNKLEDLKKSGCRELFIGIESGNDDILKKIRKPFSADMAYKTVSRILDARVAVKCYFILGLPGESEKAVRDTVFFASHLKEYANSVGVQLRISPFQFRPYHGTALYEELFPKGQNATQIQNRIDISDVGTFNPYDCISGIYAEYDQNTLNKYLNEMEKLNTYPL